MIPIICDSILICIGYFVAYLLKFKLHTMLAPLGLDISQFYPNAQIEPYIYVIYIIIPFWIISLFSTGAYLPKKGILASIEEGLNIIKGALVASVGIMAFSYIYKAIPESRYVIFYAFIINSILLISGHYIVFVMQQQFIRRTKPIKQALILGADQRAQHFMAHLIQFGAHQYKVIGVIDNQAPQKVIHALTDKLNYLGKTSALYELIEHHDIHTIFVASNQIALFEISRLAEFCDQQHLELFQVPAFYNLITTNIQVDEFAGYPLLKMKDTQRTKAQQWSKRWFDIILSAIGIVCCAPILVLVTLLIKLTSPGPVFFKQVRITRDNQEFMMLKFRTMPVNIEEVTGPVISTNPQDQRPFFIGKWLRKSSIDELPQLFNVLKGDMSLVGPRPERPFFVDQFKQEIPHYLKRHSVLPGISGWAQINGRAALSDRVDEKLMYDLYYIENWSLRFDLLILIKTTLNLIFLRDIYQ